MGRPGSLFGGVDFAERDPRISDVAQAMSRIANEARLDEPFDPWRRMDGQGIPVGFAGENRSEDISHRLAAEKLYTGEHLVEHHAEGPDVGPFVHDLPARLFG